MSAGLMAEINAQRYSDTTHSSLHVETIDSQQPQQSGFTPGFFHQPILPPANLSSHTSYHQESNPYYSPHPLLQRLGSSRHRLPDPTFMSHFIPRASPDELELRTFGQEGSMTYVDLISTTSMATHGHRNPISTSSISARDQYSGDTPTFRRPSEHQKSRSPSYPGTHRRGQPLSPAPSPMQGFTSPPRMDSGFNVKPSSQVPPLGAVTVLGQLEYLDGGSVTPIKCDINGAIDKGFFLSEGDWTCYRRNYFSCTCSFTLSPTQYPGTQIRYLCDDNAYLVHAFFMAISATVADENNQSIELVQHTPKRDKGPISTPERVALAPKQPMPHQTMGGVYHEGGGTLVGPIRGLYDPATGFPSPQQVAVNFQTEHTFERIQFKQATANNGKRRAAQQYYHLCVELWAECRSGGPERFVKVAFRKSAKMIVRGRSPGHYSDNRRNSTSQGPGGSAGSLNGFQAGSVLGPSDFPPSAGLPGNGFPGGPYEPRGGAPHAPHGMHFGAMRGPRDLPHEAYVSSEDDKAIHSTREYQYYPGSIYEGQQDSRHGISMFTHPSHYRPEDNTLMPVIMNGPYDAASGRVRPEDEGALVAQGGSGGGGSCSRALPSIFNPGVGVASRRCQPFEGKHTSTDYYPTSLMPHMGLGPLTNMT